MSINILLSFFFVYLLGFPNAFRDFLTNVLDLQGIDNIKIVGLPLALSLAALFQLVLLLLFFYKKIGDFRIKEILESLIKISIAAIMMFVSIYLVRQISVNFVNLDTFKGVFYQAGLSVLIGCFVYCLIVFALKSPEIKTIKLSFLKQFTDEPEN